MTPSAEVHVLRHAAHGIDDLHLLVAGHGVLGEIAEADGLADDEAAAVGFDEPEQHLDEGGFAGAVGPYDAHLLVAREVVVEVAEDDFGLAGGVPFACGEDLADVLCLEDLGADVGAVELQRDGIFLHALACAALEVGEGFLAVACLVAACLRRAAHPFEFSPI